MEPNSTVKVFAITEEQLAVLGKFISNLNLSWAVVNPCMAILLSLPVIQITKPEEPASKLASVK